MKIRTIIITAAIGAAASAQAQSTTSSFKDMFLRMPESVCPALTEYNRLELVDNQRNNKEMRTRNIYKTFSTMETLTDDYAHLTESKSSEKTFKLLPCAKSMQIGTPSDDTKAKQENQSTANANSIIMVISTVHSDSISDSSVSFYTTDWKPLTATAYFPEAVSDDFRTITMANGSDTLNVTTSNPLALDLDGGGTPAKTEAPHAETFIWNASNARFEK